MAGRYGVLVVTVVALALAVTPAERANVSVQGGAQYDLDDIQGMHGRLLGDLKAAEGQTAIFEDDDHLFERPLVSSQGLQGRRPTPVPQATDLSALFTNPPVFATFLSMLSQGLNFGTFPGQALDLPGGSHFGYAPTDDSYCLVATQPYAPALIAPSPATLLPSAPTAGSPLPSAFACIDASTKPPPIPDSFTVSYAGTAYVCKGTPGLALSPSGRKFQQAPVVADTITAIDQDLPIWIALAPTLLIVGYAGVTAIIDAQAPDMSRRNRRAGNQGTSRTFICEEEEEHAPQEEVEEVQVHGSGSGRSSSTTALPTLPRHAEEEALRRLGFVPRYTSKASGHLTSFYNQARTYVPEILVPQLVSWEQVASKHGQPVVNKLADVGRKILLVADGQIDGVIDYGVSFYNSSTKELQNLAQRDQIGQQFATSYTSTRNSVVKTFQDLANIAQKEGLAGSIGYARAKAGELREEGLSYAKKAAQEKSRAMLGRAQEKSKQALDALVKQPLYKKAYDSSNNLLGAAQDTTVYKQTVKRIYPLVALVADRAIKQIQPFQYSTVEYWKPASAAAQAGLS